MLGQLTADTGDDIAIADLARMLADVAGFIGTIRLEGSKPDETPRKLTDVGRLAAVGWKASIPLVSDQAGAEAAGDAGDRARGACGLCACVLS